MANELKPIGSESIDQWWANIKANSNLLNGDAPNAGVTSGMSLVTPIPPKEEEKVDYNNTLIEISNKGNQQRMDALKAFQEAQAKGLSAYQTLLKDSLKRKEEVAKKQERNARSQAIANALGSLVNVITAGAMAKKGGYAPIVANYDNTADNALRKSIEQRYALANENENLLMNLENERRKHEAEVARQNYAQEIASIDAETKAKIAPIAQQIALEEYEQKAKIRANAQKDVKSHAGEVQKDVRTHAGEVQKDVNAEKPNKGGDKHKPKPFKYDKAKIEQFVAEATTWDYEEDHPVIKGKKVKKTHTSKPNSAESAVAEQVAQYCQENKVSDNVTSVLSEVYRKLFQTIKPEVTKKFGNNLTKSIISAIKAGRNADEAYNVAKTYIEENK